MKIDAEMAVGTPSVAGSLAKRAEDCGFDCFWVNETKHDPFIQLALASATTMRISLGTSIALAFTRSPTTLAYTAWGLQSVSNGRVILGLGSQVKGHIERRFGMKWEAPAPKMRETVMAIRAVWRAWQGEARLDFRGKYFRLDLMTPFFDPGPISCPRIPIYLAGVNMDMCRTAGLVADGLHVHPLHTIRYLREVIHPALEKGAAEAGRKKGEIAIAASVFTAVGNGREEVRGAREVLRDQIAFYASTRSYRKVMELHGWGDICDRLHILSIRGEWGKMGEEVTEDMLHELVVEGTWEEIGGMLKERYDGVADRIRLYLPFDGNPGWLKVVGGFRA